MHIYLHFQPWPRLCSMGHWWQLGAHRTPLQVTPARTAMLVTQEPQVPLPLFPTSIRGLLLKLPASRAAPLAQAPGQPPQQSHTRPGWMLSSSSSTLRASHSV